jgi:hypothetical protein
MPRQREPGSPKRDVSRPQEPALFALDTGESPQWRVMLAQKCQGNHVSLREIIASPVAIMWAWVQIMWAGRTCQNQ